MIAILVSSRWKSRKVMYIGMMPAENHIVKTASSVKNLRKIRRGLERA